VAGRHLTKAQTKLMRRVEEYPGIPFRTDYLWLTVRRTRLVIGRRRRPAELALPTRVASRAEHAVLCAEPAELCGRPWKRPKLGAHVARCRAHRASPAPCPILQVACFGNLLGPWGTSLHVFHSSAAWSCFARCGCP
jgi:hypothetical protein